MKFRNNLFWALFAISFLPACLLLAGDMLIFLRSTSISLGDLIVPFCYLLISAFFVCYSFYSKPIRNLLYSIRRSMKGDYRARFSCSDFNDMSMISSAYNQLMSKIEQHTEELKQSRLIQNQMYENEKIYRSALELTSERLFEADLSHNRFDYGLEIYNHAFPFLKSEMFSEIVEEIAQNAVMPEDAEKYRQTFSRANLMRVFKENKVHEVSLDYRQLGANNSCYWINTTIIHLANASNNSLKIIGYVKNIDAQKRHELEILKQSQKDSLTGLYNKIVTQSLIEDYICGEGHEKNHALIMMDVDNFKSINDTYGHIQGDNTLIEISSRLPKIFRSTDIIGRIGGDEFFILMKDFNTEEQLIEKLTALCKMFSEIRIGENKERKISGSIGVAAYPKDGITFHDLYKKADTSLYYAKEHGKDCFYIHDRCIGSQNGCEKIDSASIDLTGYEKYAAKNISADVISECNPLQK